MPSQRGQRSGQSGLEVDSTRKELLSVVLKKNRLYAKGPRPRLESCRSRQGHEMGRDVFGQSIRTVTEEAGNQQGCLVFSRKDETGS